MNNKKKKKPVNITKLLEEEYLRHTEEDDDEMYLLKEALQKALNPVERKIYLTWIENKTYTQTARLFGVSCPTVSKYINSLKKKIIEYVGDNHS